MNKKMFNKALAVLLALAMMLLSFPAAFAYPYTEAECPGHEFDEKQVITPATCTAKGLAHYLCVNCGKDEGIDYISESFHTLIENDDEQIYEKAEWDVLPATCSSEGYRKGTCTECGVLVVDEVLPFDYSNHTDTEGYYDLDFEATSEHNGQFSVYCKDCNGLIRTETFAAHTHGNAVLADYDAGNVTLEDCYGKANVQTKLPTCTEAGSVAFLCDDCGLLMRTYDLEPVGHYSDAYYDYSTSPDPLEDYYYDRGVTTTLPTCTEAGSVVFACDACGVSVRTFTLDALGHSNAAYDDFKAGNCDLDDCFGEPNVVTSPAACTEKGTVTFLCETCGETIATYDVEAIGHYSYAYNDYLTSINPLEDYYYDKGVTTTLPTCTEAGSVVFACDACGAAMRTYTLDALGHSNAAYNRYDAGSCTLEECFGEPNVVTSSAACTEKGTVTFLCENCGEAYKTFDVEAIGHANTALADYEAGSCTLEDCFGKANVFTTPATCTENGSVSFQCELCGKEMKTFDIKAVGHNSTAYEDYLAGDKAPEEYVGWPNVIVTPAACTEYGSVVFKCETCGETIVTIEIAPTGHDEGTWRIDHEPTPDHPGQMTRYCNACGIALESKDFQKHTHEPGYEKVIIPATCTLDGEKGVFCALCGVVYQTEVIAAEGHRFGYEKVVMNATCIKDGKMGTFCAVCGEMYDVAAIPATGHDFGEWYRNNDGTHTHVCSNCGLTDTANCKYVATVTEPTCTEGGYTTYVCSDCGHTYIDDYTDALGHDWSDWIDDENDETHTRTCARCGEQETAEHCFGEWCYNHDASFFKSGTKSRVCADCGCTQTEKAHHTAWICHLFYPIALLLGSITHKAIFVGSLAWFLPWLNIKPTM